MAKQEKNREAKSKEQQSRERGQQLKSSRRSDLNKKANDAAKAAKLNPQEKQEFHRYLTSMSDDEVAYLDLVAIARHYKH